MHVELSQLGDRGEARLMAYRSVKSGRYVTESTARRHPDTTVSENCSCTGCRRRPTLPSYLRVEGRAGEAGARRRYLELVGGELVERET